MTYDIQKGYEFSQIDIFQNDLYYHIGDERNKRSRSLSTKHCLVQHEYVEGNNNKNHPVSKEKETGGNVKGRVSEREGRCADQNKDHSLAGERPGWNKGGNTMLITLRAFDKDLTAAANQVIHKLRRLGMWNE